MARRQHRRCNTANGYFVLTADMETIRCRRRVVHCRVSSRYRRQSSLIVDDLFTGPNHTLDNTTAQSGALLFDGPNGSPFSDPVPGPIVGAGVPGASAGTGANGN
jgi:hypothetical protein